MPHCAQWLSGRGS